MNEFERVYIERLYQSRAALVEAMAAAMANAEIASYSESDSNGSVSASRRSPAELAAGLEKIEKLIEDFERKHGRKVSYMRVELST
ncbi:MAG: hypothetical protein LBD20_02530 [Spirochaetaceae bacterium]|jgi:hypothetical protein|nr:hypothetical protein [Spirochaetaceae bacterium]